MSDLISREAAIDALRKCQTYLFDECDPDKKIELRSARWAIEDLPSAQPEQLTDKEKRIFLAAMNREEKVCKQVDDEHRNCREPYEDSLAKICHEITRKVKGALWMN